MSPNSTVIYLSQKHMKKTICLNMIVKDEAHVIKRCLASIKHLIDYWVIVDTGSSDGTQEVIKNFMHDIPGELHERPWVNFAHARNQAMQLARGKADYFMIIDADDMLVFSPDFSMPKLEMEVYNILQRVASNGQFQRANQVVFLFKDLPEFEWKGAVHEVLYYPRPFKQTFIQGVINHYMRDGARSQDPKRHEKDVAMLKGAIEKEPRDSRSVYYLAQTYLSHFDLKEALFFYKIRAQMGGTQDEVYSSIYYAALIHKLLHHPNEQYLSIFSKAYCYRPIRAEPIFQISQHFLEKEEYWLAYLLAQYALTISTPKKD